MIKLELTTDIDAPTGDVLLQVVGRISARDIMRVGSRRHLIERLHGALDDAVEIWRKECQ